MLYYFIPKLSVILGVELWHWSDPQSTKWPSYEGLKVGPQQRCHGLCSNKLRWGGKKSHKLNSILLFLTVLPEIFKCLVFIASIWLGELYRISNDLLCKVSMYIYHGSLMLSTLCIKMHYVISLDLTGGFSIVFRIDCRRLFYINYYRRLRGEQWPRKFRDLLPLHTDLCQNLEQR